MCYSKAKNRVTTPFIEVGGQKAGSLAGKTGNLAGSFFSICPPKSGVKSSQAGKAGETGAFFVFIHAV